MLAEYQDQVAVLNSKIAEKEKLTNYKKFSKANERAQNITALDLLYDMRNDLLFGIRGIIRQIKSMESKQNERR